MTRTDWWITTIRGRQVWPLEPEPEDVDLETIAGTLANICRFGGHCKPFYSVAQHSIRVMQCVAEVFDREHPEVPKESEVRRCLLLRSLLHDGPEHMTGDRVRPLKHGAPNPVLDAADARWAELIGNHVGLGSLEPLPDIVKVADDRCLWAERRDIQVKVHEWRGHAVPTLAQTSGLALPKGPWPLTSVLPALSPVEAENAFLWELSRLLDTSRLLAWTRKLTRERFPKGLPGWFPFARLA